MAVKKVSVPDIGTVHLYKRRGIKGMRLSITHEGAVRVSLPYWVPYAAGLDFAASKREWIRSQQVVPAPLRHGGRIGKAHRVAFIPEAGRTAIATRIMNDGEIRIQHPAHLPPESVTVQVAAQRASIRALKSQAKKLLPQRLETLARQHGFTYQDVAIKQLKSRWGSCNDEQDIALNCFLMQLPWHLIDYVLLHELMHTRIMAHGSVFWDELAHYVPNLKSIRKEIRQHRPILIAVE